MPTQYQFTVSGDDNQTVLAAMRRYLPGQPSWSSVRKTMRARLVAIGGVLCLDEARRLSRGEVVTIADRPLPPPPTDKDVAVRHVDNEVVIVEKPAGMVTLRRRSDLCWSWARKNQQPTLDECVPRLIGEHAANKHSAPRIDQRLPRLFPRPPN